MNSKEKEISVHSNNFTMAASFTASMLISFSNIFSFFSALTSLFFKSTKKRKTAEDKERLEWYDIPKGFNPESCDLEWLQDDVESLWLEIKEQM